MRTIKFRVWHPGDKVMVYDLNSLSLHHGLLVPDDYELMQFTGLLDKNGKEIFESDILRCVYAGIEEPQIIIGSVIWDDKEALFRFESDYEPEYLFECVEDAEVIGNIHDNPELLETK